ncbi:NUDIX domain-containing protein [Phytohabitans kaempferiae]|uniref:NUDIX domain-containing protein n=1 Tax=Phytohabitans kaempferiae TaxID=1620943 RepID=A0ABV6MBU5_9ACTN
MLKHATASVFLLTHIHSGWRIGLIHHPRLHRWMLPGGHLEPHENPAEAALRETSEETGLTAQLINTHTDELTDAVPGVPVPVWITEQPVPAEPRHPHPHIHIDHLYLALTTQHEPPEPAELPFGWFAPNELNGLDMFDDSRHGAHLLLARINTLTPPAQPVPADFGA